MYLEERLERLEKALEKRLDTLERVTDERISELERLEEIDSDHITASNAGYMKGILEIYNKVEALSKRVDNLEHKRGAAENVPSLFPASQEAE